MEVESGATSGCAGCGVGGGDVAGRDTIGCEEFEAAGVLSCGSCGVGSGDAAGRDTGGGVLGGGGSAECIGVTVGGGDSLEDAI